MADRARKMSAEDLSRSAAGGESSRRARPAGRDVQRSVEPTGSVAGPAAAVHGGCLARAAYAGGDRANCAPASRLQQPRRTEAEYREALEIVEQQAARLSRIVDDMFTLARADAGNYPVRRTPMYLDEVVDDVVRAARVHRVDRKAFASMSETVRSAAFSGDEDLIRRLIVNLLDNAVRHAPQGTSRQQSISTRHAHGYCDLDRGSRSGDPAGGSTAPLRAVLSARSVARPRRAVEPTAQGWVSRSRAGSPPSTAATWRSARSSSDGCTFTAVLPDRG